MHTIRDLMTRAWESGTAIPSFNIPYLPMMEPVVRALRDTETLGLIAVARLEWEKFEAGSPRAIREEYARVADERYTRLHLDHVPVIDEDNREVDYAAILSDAVAMGYDSVMVDASRLSLEGNIAATRQIVEIGRPAGVPVEGELGAVLGHEDGPLPPYEELFASRRGFTDPEEARRFVAETGVAWLSVAAGSIHGAISGAARTQKKLQARLDLAHVARLREAAGVPLVLHGGSGIPAEYVQGAIRAGIAKVNIGTAIRQPYEQGCAQSVAAGQEACYRATVESIAELGVARTARRL